MKYYLNVSYEDRDLAKRLGARWDASVKRWYCPANSALAKVFEWRKAPQSSSNSNASKQVRTKTVEMKALPNSFATLPQTTSKQGMSKATSPQNLELFLAA